MRPASFGPQGVASRFVSPRGKSVRPVIGTPQGAFWLALCVRQRHPAVQYKVRTADPTKRLAPKGIGGRRKNGGRPRVGVS